jgi:hypothetical protein
MLRRQVDDEMMLALSRSKVNRFDPANFQEYANSGRVAPKATTVASITRKRKRKMGRPPLGAAARKQILTLKLTDAEHAAVRGAVRKLGPPTTVSSWFRDHGLAPLGLGNLAKKAGRRGS